MTAPQMAKVNRSETGMEYSTPFRPKNRGSIAVHPAIADRQPHAVQQQTMEDLGIDGHALIPGIGENRFGDAVEAVLLRLVAVVVANAPGFGHFAVLPEAVANRPL